MRTLAICLPGSGVPSQRACWAGGAGGFTLIEMLVVLLLAGLLTSMVLPAMQRMMDGSQRRAAHDSILGQLDELGYEAYLQGRTTELHNSAEVGAGKFPFALPEGWEVQVKQPIVFAFTGICSGGELTLIGPDQTTEKFTLTAPDCKVYP